VRAGLKRYISHKFARGQNALVVNLLDPKIEELLSSQGLQNDQFDETQRNAILEAVRKEIQPRLSTASIPAVLTTIDVRPVFRSLIAPEFPRLPVLAYQEVSPELKIQAIARISL
jgi:type III secretion protein V